MTLTMKNYAATGGKPYCKAHYPMPIATGETRESTASVGYSSPPPQAYDASTQETQGTNTAEQVEFNNYGNQSYDQQGGYEQQQGGYDQQQQDDYYQQ